MKIEQKGIFTIITLPPYSLDYTLSIGNMAVIIRVEPGKVSTAEETKAREKSREEMRKSMERIFPTRQIKHACTAGTDAQTCPHYLGVKGGAA